MATIESLADSLKLRFDEFADTVEIANGEVSLTVPAHRWLEAGAVLKNAAEFRFEQLMDLAGVDYLEYGITEWSTDASSSEGFSRGVAAETFARFRFEESPSQKAIAGSRFMVAYQLLSLAKNWRLRVKVPCPNDAAPRVPSVIGVWRSADWFEREAFDLFGIMFEGHPDLRRILTDYGFVGHPFRKDFPLVGHVEMRYDPEQERVIYQPVTIEPRVLVPKVRRADHRYVRADG